MGHHWLHEPATVTHKAMTGLKLAEMAPFGNTHEVALGACFTSTLQVPHGVALSREKADPLLQVVLDIHVLICAPWHCCCLRMLVLCGRLCWTPWSMAARSRRRLWWWATVQVDLGPHRCCQYPAYSCNHADRRWSLLSCKSARGMPAFYAELTSGPFTC